MTALSDHITTVKDWLNREDYSDPLVTSWTRMFEQNISTSIRCKHMIQIDTGTIVDKRVLLPSDWLELDFVRIVNGKPLRFRSRDTFYDNPDADDANYNSGSYTLSGNYLMVGGNLVPGRAVELHYFQTIPPLGVASNWLMQYYSSLYVFGTLVAALMYGLEDDRAQGWKTAVTDTVAGINDEYMKSKSAGSTLVMPRRKGYG